MKIIDILNKMADGTLEDRFKFVYDDRVFTYKKEKNICFDEDDWELGESYHLEKCLNDEVSLFQDKTECIANREVIEETKKVENKKVKQIQLVFENCEVCTLTPDMFKYLRIERITKNKSINCYQYEKGECDEYNTCEEFSVEINKKGLALEMWSGILKDRLIAYADITSICITYEDETEEEIFVPWSDESDFNNTYQNTKLNNDGSITIKIENNQLKVK